MKLCKQCGEETNNKKFCSRSCAAKFNNVGVRRHGHNFREPCLWCGKIVGQAKNSFCSLNCHKEYEFWSYINRWMLGLENGCKGTSKFVVSTIVRRYLKEINNNNKCSRCGWGVANPINNVVYLEIDHIDGDATNNSFKNLALICPNCHTLTSTYKTLNIGNGSNDRLKYFNVLSR